MIVPLTVLLLTLLGSVAHVNLSRRSRKIIAQKINQWADEHDYQITTKRRPRSFELAPSFYGRAVSTETIHRITVRDQSGHFWKGWLGLGDSLWPYFVRNSQVEVVWDGGVLPESKPEKASFPEI